jgi:hypothetical protein
MDFIHMGENWTFMDDVGNDINHDAGMSFVISFPFIVISFTNNNLKLIWISLMDFFHLFHGI